jgi:hypothetical protein
VKLGGLNAKGIKNRDEAKERAEALRPLFAELAGMSARKIAAALNDRNVPTPNGGPWSAVTVIRVQRRLEAWTWGKLRICRDGAIGGPD